MTPDPKPLLQTRAKSHWLNQVRARAAAARVGFSPFAGTIRTSKGSIVSPLPQSAPSAPGAQFKRVHFKSLADDHNSISVIDWDGAEESGSEYTVALPYKLRAESWDQKAITYPALINLVELEVRYTKVGPQERYAQNTATGFEEYQSIVPRYLVGDELIIVNRKIRVYAGVNYTDYNWLEMNNDGRAWARF